MMPIGPALYLWRVSKGLRQEDLARRAGIPRPNLSAIERGRRDVTLKTLRVLANALGVTPGILADGVPPGHVRGASFSRWQMERIVKGALGRGPELPAQEREVARHLAPLVRDLRALFEAKARRGRTKIRQVRFSKLFLNASLSPAVFRNLLERVHKELLRKP